MKVRKAERVFSEELGLQIKCPVCNALWYKMDVECKVSRDECEHLRFSYFDGEFEFYGDWDKEVFREEYGNVMQDEAMQEQMNESEWSRDAFRAMKSKEIDAIIYFMCDPIQERVGLWGYKRR